MIVHKNYNVIIWRAIKINSGIIMRIVHIEDFFHPDAGYQINILPKYLTKFGHEQIIITSTMDRAPSALKEFFSAENIEEKDKKYTENNNVKIIRLPLRAFISGRAIFFKKQLLNTIKSVAPDVLFVHGNDTLTGMQMIQNRMKLPCPMVLDSHMLDMASQNKFSKLFHWFYKCFYTPKIIKNKIPVIRTQNDSYVKRRLGIPLELAPWISYGSDTLLFHPDNLVKERFREENKISKDSLIVCYAGKLVESKGGLFLAEAIKNKFNVNREIVFLIIGNTVGEYGQKVERVLETSVNRIIRFPTQKYSELAKYYQVADLAVFPRQCSLSFYDVQACGLPVLFEDNNINIERSAHGNGWTFRSGDILDFKSRMEFIANMSENDLNKYSQNSMSFIYENYNYMDKAREYEKVLFSFTQKKEQQ